MDSVVIPYYRNNDQSPQFYCVSSIDSNLKPYSPFPTSSHQHNKPPVYSTFFQYFAYKYNIRITDLNQSLLIVNHPSTRLNLLTPRYMNMKATVLQKSSSGQQRDTSINVINKKFSSNSSNQIYLVPELVNVHPLRASIWRRCMCLPSILYRLNCLLLAEELRREIARSTGVGFPWVDTDNIKVSFL